MNEPDYFPDYIVETQTVATVRKAVEFALGTRFPVRLIGRPGTGKSCAMWHVAKEWNGIYLEISHATKKVKPLFQALLRARGADIWQTYASQVEDQAFSTFDIGDMLFVDEVQTLELTALRELLRLKEQCNFVLILAGNAERLAGAKKDADTLDQVNSRILPPWSLPGPSKEDCEKIGATYNVEGRDAYALLAAFGTATNMRELAQILEAAKLFRPKGVGIRREHLESAIRLRNPKPELLKLLKSEVA